ncbi:MAG: NADP-dependent phosphogluconate dehydrogenase [Bacteroidetes bacterium]|nr:NADP-dependent phosphogluconate dehydrogenase [Bacteroidota bacterium]MBS1757214.1 NADP-dependent phosphogluconate dehydrogenase [Bacteroidota bacterium]
MSAYSYGMVGLGTMGCNLVLNMSDHGYSVAGYDKDATKTDALNKLGAGKQIMATTDVKAFVQSLEVPRVIMLLVPAGKIVDYVIADLKPFLSDHDIIIDCGNSHFTDTQIRIDTLVKENLHFMGLGVSGGETGARFGPSIMPGGDVEAYNRVAPMLQAIAAKVNGDACTAYMGNGSAGHYVKMVHNGIEYAIMQLISECYHLLKNYAGLSNDELHQVFDTWSKGKLQSFLMEITAAVFTQNDDAGNGLLIDKIADTAHQKGTGAWMSQDAMNIGYPIPAIDAAVSQRILSSMKAERVAAANTYQIENLQTLTGNKTDFINQLEDALHAGYIISYAQGLAMLQLASDTYKYNVNIATVASIWRGGCIIRAAMLEDITEAFTQQPGLKNLMLAASFQKYLSKEVYSLKGILKTAINQAIPTPALSACMHYYDSYFSAWLPANLIQAQRDFFGAHTYERNDKDGVFHTNWNQIIR